MQRRQLLRRGAAFFSVIAAGPLITACGGGNGNGNAGQGPGSGDSGPPLGTHVFGLGVASITERGAGAGRCQCTRQPPWPSSSPRVGAPQAAATPN